MKYLISLFKSLFHKKSPRNTVIGKSLNDVPFTTGNNSTQLGVNDPNYTGDFFETTLPDGTVVKTRDRIHIGTNALKNTSGGFHKNTGIGYKAGHYSECGIGFFEPYHNTGSKDTKIKFSKS